MEDKAKPKANQNRKRTENASTTASVQPWRPTVTLLTSWKDKETRNIMIIFGNWIMYLYLESIRPLWKYWSPVCVCVTRETLSAVGLSWGQALHLISHLSAWIQPPPILSVITCACSSVYTVTVITTSSGRNSQFFPLESIWNLG